MGIKKSWPGCGTSGASPAKIFLSVKMEWTRVKVRTKVGGADGLPCDALQSKMSLPGADNASDRMIKVIREV